MMFQALFPTNIEGFIYVSLIIVVVIIINRLISFVLKKSKHITRKVQIYSQFFLQLLSFAIIIYFLLNGIPIVVDFIEGNPAQVAVFTGSISIAIAFASSGMFSNLISGFMLFSLKPFEVGDLIKIDDEIGVVRAINLTTTIIETFDNILVEKANNDVISSEIINYTINLDELKSFVDFKKAIQSSEDSIPPNELKKTNDEDDLRLKKIFKAAIKRKKKSKLFNYLFPMEFPYDGFHKLISEVEKVCSEFSKKFGFKPLYHIFGFDNFIKVNFRILTFDSKKIFNQQPNFAKKIYTLIFQHYLNLKKDRV